MPPESRPMSYSRAELTLLVMPHMQNVLGSLFGGELMAMVDQAAAVAAIRHAGGPTFVADPTVATVYNQGQVCISIQRIYVHRDRYEDFVEAFSAQAAPCGAPGRPLRKANVVSSGAISPARAPPSMLMLQTVIRSSIVSPRTASPVYSMQ